MVSKVLNGYNSTILVYGQTGSGKTYTMQGLPFNDSDNVETANFAVDPSDEDGIAI